MTDSCHLNVSSLPPDLFGLLALHRDILQELSSTAAQEDLY